MSRLRAWQADLVAAGIGVGTIEKARKVLSSILRHAAESEEIAGNPLGLVRPPAYEQKDSVHPLAPFTVESIRAVIAGPMDIVVPTRLRRGKRVASYVVPDERDHLTRLRDATIVSVLAYDGERPGELRGNRWRDIFTRTILIERAANPDGSLKGTKTGQKRSTRLFGVLMEDLHAYYVAAGEPPLDTLILPGEDHDHGWTKSDWQVWRARHWGKACRLAGLASVPRPYDLRHSFASLLLAEGRKVHYVARQLGTSERLVLDTYGHLFEEYDGADPIDPIAEIRAARAEIAALRQLRHETAESGTHVHAQYTNQLRGLGRRHLGKSESPAFAGLSPSTPKGSQVEPGGDDRG